MKPKIIAEACQNHNGDLEVLKRIIHTAAQAGADYVKIQAIRSKELTRRDRFEEGAFDSEGTQIAIKRPYQPEFDRLSKLDLNLDEEAWFTEECQRAGVASMTTVFTRCSIRDVSAMGYDAIKVASYDCGSFPLLRDVKRFWSTVVVSTGASYDNEIEETARILEGRNFSFLHCVSIYPTPMEQCHFRRMQYLRRFTPHVGWSDHTLVERDGIWASKIALALGADWIERHYTVLDKDRTKDGPVSVSPEQLQDLRDFADRPRQERMKIIQKEYPNWEASLGQMQRSLSLDEKLNRDYYRGRFASPKETGGWIYNWEDIEIP